ncbi:MAG: hypothetical protein WC184_04140 [Acidimicrobiia bacterium]
MEGPLSRRATLAWIVLYLAMSGWAMHWLWGPELAPGMDTTGHLVRLDTAFELFRHGRLDGWMDRSMLGYQLHLVYGPGFAIIAALIKALSFGTFSTALVYKLIGFLAISAIPFAGMALSRSLGLSPQAAWISGLFMLTVSSFNGSGIEGAFLNGLVPQQVGTAMVLGAWALLLARQTNPWALGLMVGAMAFTHPYSLVMFVYFVPFLLVVLHLQKRRIAWSSLMSAALIALLVSAWWWIPAFAGRDLQGPMTWWPSPGFWGRFKLLASGDRGMAMPASTILLAAMAWTFYSAIKDRKTNNLLLLIAPIAAFGLLSSFSLLVQDQLPAIIQLTDRALPFVIYLLIPTIAMVLVRFNHVGVSLSIFVVLIATPLLVPPLSTRYRATTSLDSVAAALAANSTSATRYALAEAPRIGFGVPEPSRYLGWKAKTADLSIFGPEWAPGSEVSFKIYSDLTPANIDEWLESMRQAGISHLISARTTTAQIWSQRNDLELIETHGELALWELLGPRSA